jgi:ElaB/YqjD/DUF883 family membrane-anchored ribosome-binding protein
MDQRPDNMNAGWIEDRHRDVPRLDDDEFAVSEIGEPATSEAERIKADIEDTRAEMGQTINEIQERLSPDNIIEQVKDSVRDATIGKVERAMDKVGEKFSNVTEPALEAMGRAGTAIKETGTSVTNTVRRNPIPVALIGLGVGMLVVNRIRNADGRTMRSSTYRLGGRQLESGMFEEPYGTGREYASSSREYGDSGTQYGGSTRSTIKQVRDSAGDLASGTVERVSELGDQAKEGALWAGREFQRLLRQNPLAVGAAAVAVGAAVGLALPTTQVESEYMGEASEKLVDKAQQVARDAMDKVKTAAQEATGGANPGQQAGGAKPGQPSPQSPQRGA